MLVKSNSSIESTTRFGYQSNSDFREFSPERMTNRTANEPSAIVPDYCRAPLSVRDS